MIQETTDKQECSAKSDSGRGTRPQTSRKGKVYPYTREQLLGILHRKAAEIGHKPTKKDMPEQIREYYRIFFGKWCYALEEAGLSVPSEKTLERRRRHAMRHRRSRGQKGARALT